MKNEELLSNFKNSIIQGINDIRSFSDQIQYEDDNYTTISRNLETPIKNLLDAIPKGNIPEYAKITDNDLNHIGNSIGRYLETKRQQDLKASSSFLSQPNDSLSYFSTENIQRSFDESTFGIVVADYNKIASILVKDTPYSPSDAEILSSFLEKKGGVPAGTKHHAFTTILRTNLENYLKHIQSPDSTELEEKIYMKIYDFLIFESFLPNYNQITSYFSAPLQKEEKEKVKNFGNSMVWELGRGIGWHSIGLTEESWRKIKPAILRPAQDTINFILENNLNINIDELTAAARHIGYNLIIDDEKNGKLTYKNHKIIYSTLFTLLALTGIATAITAALTLSSFLTISVAIATPFLLKYLSKETLIDSGYEYDFSSDNIEKYFNKSTLGTAITAYRAISPLLQDSKINHLSSKELEIILQFMNDNLFYLNNAPNDIYSCLRKRLANINNKNHRSYLQTHEEHAAMEVYKLFIPTLIKNKDILLKQLEDLDKTSFISTEITDPTVANLLIPVVNKGQSAVQV